MVKVHHRLNYSTIDHDYSMSMFSYSSFLCIKSHVFELKGLPLIAEWSKALSITAACCLSLLPGFKFWKRNVRVLQIRYCISLGTQSSSDTVEHTYDACPKYSELGSFRIIAYLYVSEGSRR